MFGDKTEDGKGIIPRAAEYDDDAASLLMLCRHIFEAISKNREKKGTEFDIKCSFVEIYMVCLWLQMYVHCMMQLRSIFVTC